MFTSSESLINYSVEAPVTDFYQNGSITANILTSIRLPRNLSGPSYHWPNRVNDAYKEGIHLQTSGDEVTVIGSYVRAHFDTFFVVPTVDLGLDEYTYYALSVSGHYSTDGSVVLVGITNQTMLNISVPVRALIKINNSVDWSSMFPGILYSYEIQGLETIYIATPGIDLTGIKVTTDKQISLFSGHECVVNEASRYCDILVEQIPPTRLWGRVYFFAPLAGWMSYKIKIVAAYDSTNIDIHCNNSVNSYTVNAGNFINVIYNNQEFCGVYASREVLVAQFSEYNDSQSMMTLIPSTDHYTNSITSSTPNNYYSLSYNHSINIIVLADYYQPEMISIASTGGVLDSLSWVPIMRNNVTDAYAAQVSIPHGIFEVTHVNNSALMTLIVYGLATTADYIFSDVFPEGYGHPGWLMGQINAFNGMYVSIAML